MLLTITTTHRPARDLGHLLRKNPARVQSFELSSGQAHVFYPEPAGTQVVSSVLNCTYRVLLTGIYLMRSGEIEANLLTLNEEFRLPFLHELIELKLRAPEKASINGADISFHEIEVNRLRQELEEAYATSRLPEFPSEEIRAQLSKLLVRFRMNPPVKIGK